MKLGNDHFLVQTLINLGMNYYSQGNSRERRERLKQGLEKARAIGNPRPEVYLLTSLADIKRDAGDLRRRP